MIRQPEIYTAANIKAWDVSFLAKDGSWKPCRPEGSNIRSVLWRWHLAWLVLTGQCDVLGWNDRQGAADGR